MAKEFSETEIRDIIVRYVGPEGPDDDMSVRLMRAEITAQVNRWLERGDGIAVYENWDMGHPDLGELRLISYGSGESALKSDTPPNILPDWPGVINWRYSLVGTYRGESL